MNHYPRHVGDYIRDTVGLSMLEEGAYTRLLDQYYVRDGPLPADMQILYRLARATSKAERAAVDSVLAIFFIPGEDGWHQKRADRELETYRARSDSASLSAQSRWSKRNAIAMPTQCEGNANQNQEPEPVTKTVNQKKEQKPARKPKLAPFSLAPASSAPTQSGHYNGDMPE